MKGFTIVTALACLAMTAMPAAAQTDPVRVDLIAGQTTDVGDVLLWNDCGTLHVKFCLDPFIVADPLDNWYLTQVQVQVALSPGGIPQKNGNPVPGLFEINKSYDHVLCSEEFQIALPEGASAGTSLYIAAHAVVEKLGGVPDLKLALPDKVTMSVKYPYTGGYSYFPEVRVTGGMMLDGTLNSMLNSIAPHYSGWCVDTDHVIYPYPTSYTARVFSSYENVLNLVEHPENLDVVNWILNQNYVGTASPSGYGIYTYGDVQRAIWTLVDDQVSDSSLGPWSALRVAEILAAATLYGDGFVPGCDQKVAVLLAPVSGATTIQVIIAQVTLIDLKMPCESEDETAWGNGTAFAGKNWATYIQYTVQECPVP